jgi:2-iminobutanoate/2-iminopropanoate deaminase
MTKKIIKTSAAPAPPASYSQAVVAAGLVFISGQGPFDPTSGEIVGVTIQEQTAQCLRNVSAILKAAGSSIDNVVSATFILAEEQDFAGLNEEWAKWFSKDPPARQGAKLPVRPKGMKISVAVIAEV